MDKKTVQDALEDTTAGEILAWAGGMGLLLVVLGFLGFHSLNAFAFVFEGEKEYLAPLGFGMTGIGAIVYLLKLVNSRKASNLKKTIYFVMLVVCGVGEILTALFGMRLEAFKKAGFELSENAVEGFFLIMGALAFLHFISIVGEYGGDVIVSMFSGIKLPFFGKKQNTVLSQAVPLAADADQMKIVHPNGKEVETAANFTEGER